MSLTGIISADTIK